jgi:hypothetical protein
MQKNSSAIEISRMLYTVLDYKGTRPDESSSIPLRIYHTIIYLHIFFVGEGAVRYPLSYLEK